MTSRSVLIALGWLVALSLLGILLAYTFSVSDLTDFLNIVKSANPVWVVAMACTEIATYFCTAGMYGVMLKSLGIKVPFKKLLPLSMEKLVVDQFIPTAGVGGSTIVVHGLKRVGATRQAGIAMVVTGLAAWYIAGDLAGVFGLITVRDIPVAFSGGITFFGLYFLVSIFIIYVTLHGVRTKTFERIKNILPGKALDTFFTEMAQNHKLGLATKSRLSKATLFQLGIILLDAGTLAFACLALGTPIPYVYALTGYALANMAATISVLPGGIGVFEGGSVAVLSFLGMTPATALAAIILYRGFSVWLPMIPGTLMARREIHHSYFKKQK